MDDREFMSNPDLWPNWPLLPIKKRGHREVGVLWNFGTEIRFGENQNMYMLNTEGIQDWPIANIVQLLEEGWVVD